MHNMLASGGVLQYELNQLTRRIMRLGYSRADLDSFAAIVKKPKHGITMLPRNFFLERIVDRDGSNLKGYAGEVLTLLSILSYFCEKILMPGGRLPEECQCLRHAKRAMDILTYHKVSMVDRLEDHLLKHHVLFAKLYADCVKFKPRWQLHVPAAVRRSIS